MNERPLSNELHAFREYRALRQAPVFRGLGVPHGDGRQVLILPGLFANDFYLRPLRDWLRRIGYRPRPSLIALNAGCPNEIRRRVERTFLPSVSEHERVAIIGHSRGGMIGKAIASGLGERCSHFITLGSPVGAIMRGGEKGLEAMVSSRDAVAAKPVAQAGRLATRMISPRCDLPRCGCEYVQRLLAPLHPETRAFAIRTEEDPVVEPDSCVIEGAENVVVRGTHSGLVFNRDVYPHLAAMLAG